MASNLLCVVQYMWSKQMANDQSKQLSASKSTHHILVNSLLHTMFCYCCGIWCFFVNTMFVAEYHGFEVCFTIFVNPCRESMSLRQSFPCQKIPCRIALFQKAEGKICRFHPRICHKPSPVVTINGWYKLTIPSRGYIILVYDIALTTFQWFLLHCSNMKPCFCQILPCIHKYKDFLQIYRNNFGCDWK